MKIYSDISAFKNVEKPIITTGTFDGVHFGHRKIISRLTQIAKDCGGETVLLTFAPHPRMVLFPEDHGLQLINTLEEKIKLLEGAGIQHLIIYPFTLEFSRTKSMTFVRDILVNQLHVYKLVIGYNHHFGRNREGSFENLQEYSNLYGFEVEEIPVQLLDEVNVSSTKVRKALTKGDVKLANKFLGYHYSLIGKVVKGQEIGRKIGFPTANIQVVETAKLIPENGVYAVKANILGKEYNGMMNIGFNPTISGFSQSLEVHIFDFDASIYGKEIRITFFDRIRSEIKFESLEALQEQLQYDKSLVQSIFLK